MTYEARTVHDFDEPEGSWREPANTLIFRGEDLAEVLTWALGFMKECDPCESAVLIDADGKRYSPDHSDTVDDVLFS